MNTSYRSLEELLEQLDQQPVGKPITPDRVEDNSLLAPQYAGVRLKPAEPAELTARQRTELVRVMMRAALKCVALHDSMTYTQALGRWDGIDRAIHDWLLSHGFKADCSSWASWLGWVPMANWLRWGDILNGLAWRAGWTGSLVQHGWRVSTPSPGDFVFYGDLYLPYHVAVSVGNGKCASHGHPGAPEIVPIIGATQFRRYF